MLKFTLLKTRLTSVIYRLNRREMCPFCGTPESINISLEKKAFKLVLPFVIYYERKNTSNII